MLRTLCALLLALLVAAPAARADLLKLEGRFGSFEEATAVAVDNAGRVYVADAAARRVEVFERAQDGNRRLASIGGDRLRRPVGVAVDNRQRVFVADAERNVIEVFGSSAEEFRHRGTIGSPGQKPGQLDGPRALASDPSLRMLVLEAGNLRVSLFRPSGGRLPIFQSAFGLSAPEPLRAPTAIARDGDGRVYVAGAEGVRALDRRGRFIAALGARYLTAPRGVAADRFDRVVISDEARDRIEVLGPLAEGAVRLETFAGVEAPGPVTFAPGALLYVLAGNRVVRLRFDDSDQDSVPDAGDNCAGLGNSDQANADRDAQGDACDGDDDDDGRADADDRCPTEPSRAGDADGCRDVTSRFLIPAHGRAFESQPQRLVGRSEGGELGVSFVEVALARRLDRRPVTSPDAQCSFLDPAARGFVARACADPVWVRATGQDTWRLLLPPGLLDPGSFAVFARAHQRNGPVETRLRPGRNVREFTIVDA